MENGGFPSPIASKEVKSSMEYGLNYGNAIWGEHVKNITVFNDRRNRFINNRQYAEGLESVQKYKNRLDLNGDASYVNLDFTPINVIATRVDSMVSKLFNKTFKIQCNPIDSESLTQYDDYRKKLHANAFLSKVAKPLEEKTGVSIIPTGEEVFESKDDIEMHLRLNYKMDAAMAMESAIQWVDNNNLFEDVRKRVLRDLVVNKWAAIYHYYDENGNIRREYVDVADLITPYSKYDDFRNIPYVGVLKQYQIYEIAQQNPDFTDEDLFYIARTQAGANKNPVWNWGDTYEGYYTSNTGSKPYMNFNISVLEFYFKTEITETRLKKQNSKGGFFFKNKSVEVNPDNINVIDLGGTWGVKGEKLTVSKEQYKDIEGAKNYFASIKTDRRKEVNEVIEKRYNTVYEGRLIPGTKYLYNYKMRENVERTKINGSYSPECELPITIIAPDIYDMQNKSVVERAIPIQDQMTLAHLKLQQNLIKAIPPGVYIDVSAMDGLITTMGEGTKPEDILKMYLQTGSVAGSSQREDGSVLGAPPVQQLSNGVGNTLQAYIGVQQYYMQKLDELIGYNDARNPISPDNSGFGVQKMAQEATENALRPIYNAHLNLILRDTERVMLMIQDSMEYNEEAFIMAIGQDAVDTIKYGKKLAYNQFAIEVEVAPDTEEKMSVEGDIQLGLQNQTLFVSDAIRIRQELKYSAKAAAQLLCLLEEKNQKDKQQQSMQLQEQNAQVQQQSAQVAAQTKMQSELAIEKAKQETLQLEYKLKLEFEQAQQQGRMQLQGAKNEGEISVASLNNHGKAVVQQVSNEGKLNVEEVKSNNSIIHKAFDHTVEQGKEQPQK